MQTTKGLQKESHHDVERSTIVKVEEKEGYYLITTDSSTCYGGISKPAKVVPEVGNLIKLYLYGGMRVRGVDLDGEEVFFKTDEDLEGERIKAVKKHEEEMLLRKQKFDQELTDQNSDFNKRLGSLPKVFKQRFKKFFRLGEHFWDLAWYELVACETALKIAYTCRGWQKIRKFQRMSWVEQKKMIPSLDEGLSGNQFGFACCLAAIYLKDSKNVLRVRGALFPLVGSRPYIGR